jgi:hypothetical protein
MKVLFSLFPEMYRNITTFDGCYASPAFFSVTLGTNIIPPMLGTHFHYDFTFEGYKEFTFYRPKYKVQFVPHMEHSMLPSARSKSVCCIAE